MTPLAPLLITAGLIAGLAMAVFLASRALRERRLAYWRRRLLGPPEADDVVLLGGAAGPAPTWSRRLDEAFERLVEQTGLGWTAAQGLGLMALLGVVLAGVLLLWRGDLWLTGVGLVVGLALPVAGFLILRSRRRRQLQEQLPDAFFLLARSLRAGESLEQALATVAEHGIRPLGEEFRAAVERIKLGLTVPAALQALARRLQLTDFNVFVTAVTLHRTIGGNLALLLDRVANSTRDRNLFRGYFRASTALSRITGFVIAAAPPILFIGFWMWRPDFASAFTRTAGGVRLMTVAAVLELVGVVWLFSLLRNNY